MPSEPKTRPTDASVDAFIEAVPNARRREEARQVAALLAEVSGETPMMWGESIVGYGSYKGPTGGWPVIGFSPRKGDLVIYLMVGFAEQADLLDRLGPHRTGSGCLYLKRLDAVELPVLKLMAERSIERIRDRYPTR